WAGTCRSTWTASPTTPSGSSPVTRPSTCHPAAPRAATKSPPIASAAVTTGSRDPAPAPGTSTPPWPSTSGPPTPPTPLPIGCLWPAAPTGRWSGRWVPTTTPSAVSTDAGGSPTVASSPDSRPVDGGPLAGWVATGRGMETALSVVRCYRSVMTDTAAKQPRPLEITAGAEPIKLGSMLLTVVEPHRGHEVAYNRWYERDHFYAGCMIGPYQFAGRRYVATADLKAMRTPDPSAITGEPARGSYVSVYWVLDGYHDTWNRWAVRQVRALHAAGRMFEARDHVHTLLYRYAWEQRRDPDGVPVELALDHPYKGFVALWIDRADDV